MWAQEQLVDLWLVMVLPKTVEDAQDPFLSSGNSQKLNHDSLTNREWTCVKGFTQLRNEWWNQQNGKADSKKI